ncbi:MAG TPA: thymidylate synthase [Candidatus Enterousia intestinigallinarum]|uniref:Thymidylate synthase n=1 Tax=Candidatus Enterousia intestinigallinarum TaxID=2840790 RepID=A0A9D1JX02_9PROT|nr:thymidylate synthase [Candidatus Enterousia intestinigallinarum]
MKAYLDILDNIMTNATDLRMNRTGIPDIGLSAGAVFEHDMSTGFPLITTKKMGLKNIATELEFFLHGITDKRWLQDRKCHIWDEWANPVKVEQKYNIATNNLPNLTDDEKTNIRNAIMDSERDLGPIYGFQWRHFGGEYVWNENRINKNPTDNFNPKNPGIDQVQNAIYKLKNNPNDRRILVSAWNPVALPQMALPPCHVMHQLVVRDGKLSLIWTQRSCDMFLGVPYNIASYALLLLLYAKEAGLKPGMLKGELHDAHIYQNHIPQVREQLKRKPYPLPTVEIPDDNWRGMLNWSAQGGFVLKNYICHEKLRGEVAR